MRIFLNQTVNVQLYLTGQSETLTSVTFVFCDDVGAVFNVSGVNHAYTWAVIQHIYPAS